MYSHKIVILLLLQLVLLPPHNNLAMIVQNVEVEIERSADTTTTVMHPKYTKEHQAIQYEALKYSGLAIPDEIASFDVPIGNGAWLHEIRCGFKNKEHIVLLHGYGGSSMTYIRLFKELSKRYVVHALDSLGVGLSHRSEYKVDSDSHTTVQYYINAIQNWRKEMKIKKFVLAGHSFGGYLASRYAGQHPQAVSRLVLISPPGVRYSNKQMSEQEYQNMLNEATCGRRLFLRIVKNLVHSWKPTPSQGMTTAILGDMFLERILTGRLKLTSQEKDTWKSYFKAIARISPNSEKAFFNIFHFPRLGCEIPISQVVVDEKLGFKVQFYYGDIDWMEKKTAQELVAKYPSRMSYTTVSNSGHQILFDNPQLMARYMLQEEMNE